MSLQLTSNLIKKVRWILLLSFLSLVICSVSANDLCDGHQNELSLLIKNTSEVYKLGSPIHLRLCITSSSYVFFCNRYYCDFNLHFVVEDEDGKMVKDRWNEILDKETAPKIENIVLLRKGDTLCQSIDFGRGYKFKTPGVYYVQAIWESHLRKYFHDTYGDSFINLYFVKAAHPKNDVWEGCMKSNRLTIRIVEDKKAWKPPIRKEKK